MEEGGGECQKERKQENHEAALFDVRIEFYGQNKTNITLAAGQYSQVEHSLKNKGENSLLTVETHTRKYKNNPEIKDKNLSQVSTGTFTNGYLESKKRVSWTMFNEKLSLCTTRRMREDGLKRGLAGRPN